MNSLTRRVVIRKATAALLLFGAVAAAATTTAADRGRGFGGAPFLGGECLVRGCSCDGFNALNGNPECETQGCGHRLRDHK